MERGQKSASEMKVKRGNTGARKDQGRERKCGDGETEGVGEGLSKMKYVY